MRRIGAFLYRYAKHLNLHYDAIAGLPNAGTLIAKGFKEAAKKDGRNVPMVVLHKEEEGERREIVGVIDYAGFHDQLAEGKEIVILVLDDLITHGKTKEEGLRVLERDKFTVRDVLVFMDREQGGTAYLRERGQTLRAPTTLRWAVQHGGNTRVP